jgi:hypothetical protein
MTRIFLRFLPAAIALAIACTPTTTSSSRPSPTVQGAQNSPASSATMTAPASASAGAGVSGDATGGKAGDLRLGLDLLLEEHVYLAGFATSEALLGNDAGFKGAAAVLDTNTVGLGKAIGTAYGSDAEAKFLELWRAHIGMFAAYAKGAAAKDDAAKQKARADLDGYRRDFDAFITGANPNLPKGAVAELLVPHVEHLTAAIDGVASGDFQAGFSALKMAADQTEKIADPLAIAIVKQFPDKFPGNPTSKAVDLRVTLNDLLGEHVYLAGLPVRMALAGSDPGFKAGAAVLDENTVELSKAIGSVYGAEAEAKFLELWRAHIGMFVEYTQRAAANDDAKKSKAKADLDGYRRDFDAFITGANPNLPKGAVASLLVEHVDGIVKAIDALAAKDYAAGYRDLKMAEDHSQMIADPLSGAIVKQFPAKF